MLVDRVETVNIVHPSPQQSHCTQETRVDLLRPLQNTHIRRNQHYTVTHKIGSHCSSYADETTSAEPWLVPGMFSELY